MSLTVSGQELTHEADTVSRPVTSVYSIGIGGVTVCDTYLSPLRYHGVEAGVSGLWAKVLPGHDSRLTMEFAADISGRRALNPSRTSSMLGLQASFSWGLMRRWTLPARILLQAGGDIGFDAGVFYLPRNSNNPASAKFSADLGALLKVSRPVRAGALPVLLSDRLSLPVVSLFFAPQYGEPYYEIYLGNHSGLAHCGWWGNHFCIDNTLSADLDFGRTALRIGYRFRLGSSWVEHTDFRCVSHLFVIGVIPGGLGLKPRTPSRKTMAINALY